eukprot:164065-Amphidinium_carterae.1
MSAIKSCPVSSPAHKPAHERGRELGMRHGNLRRVSCFTFLLQALQVNVQQEGYGHVLNQQLQSACCMYSKLQYIIQGC